MDTQGGAPSGVDEEVAGLRGEFPDFHFWRGVTGLLYVWRVRSSPPWVRHGKTVDDVRGHVLSR